MGCKRKLTVSALLVLVLFIISVMIYHSIIQKKEDYDDKLISSLDEKGNVTVQDIFPFEFKRAYVLNDCYISGEGFSKRYNLDISIDEVQAGVSENIQRIVFVDEFGDFVYEFKCDSNKLILHEKGIIIYPETMIEKNKIQENPVTISFRSVDRYDH